nr:hypothetical protein [Tanacetum cinerariifolium]
MVIGNPLLVGVNFWVEGSLDSKPNAGLWVQFHEHHDLHRQSEHHMMVSTGRFMFLLVVLIPAGSFVPTSSYGLCWWLRVPTRRHTSAGGFISIGGCVFLLLSRFLLIVDSFCWLDTFMLLALFMLSKHLNLYLLSQRSFCCAQYDTAGWSVSTGSHSVSTERILLIDFEPAGYKWELNSVRF